MPLRASQANLLKKRNIDITVEYIRLKISNFAAEMCSTDKLLIDMKALVEGESAVAGSLGDGFFSSVEGSEITQGDVHVEVSIRKTPHFSEVVIHAQGEVTLPCDRCLDPMQVSVETEQKLIVKFGDEASEDDEMIVLAESEPTLDVAWLVYESIVLNLPVKHVHAPGKCNPAMINVLNEHSATRSDDTVEEEHGDHRWEKLASLKDLLS